MRNATDHTSSDAQAANNSLIESNRVEGTEVFDPSGKHIGSIKRLVIDKASGRVVYTVASFGGFLGMGGDEYGIPWKKLSYNPDLGGYQTDITEAQLRGSPEFARNSDDSRYDRANEALLYDYYNTQERWTE